MALPDYLKIGSLVSTSTGISSQQIANGATYTSTTEIDNTTARYGYMAVEAVWQYATAPTANKSVEVYLLRSLDGTNYEEVAPQALVAGFSPPADTTTHRRVLLTAFPLVAAKYKFAVRNVDTAQSITISLNAWRYYESIED